jgi:AraC-like DNA-binding protein
VDAISEAVASTRSGRAVAARSRYASGPWSTRFPAIHGSGLHIVRRGTLWFIPEEGRPAELRAGDVVFVPRGPAHGFSDAPIPLSRIPEPGTRSPDLEDFTVEFVSCCYHLDRGRIHEIFGELPDVLTLTLDHETYPMLGNLTELLSEHAADRRPGSDIALPAVVDLLLVHLLRAWHNGDDRLEPHIAKAVRAVQEDPNRPWSVQQLSELAHLSRSSFSRKFTEAMGETPRDYLLRRRLDQAAHLLRHTELPMATIASQLGYATAFSFSTAFRREFGLPPSNFRQNVRADR